MIAMECVNTALKSTQGYVDVIVTNTTNIMKAIDFYKFIHENNIEFHWGENPETKERDVIFFPIYSQIDDFSNILTTFDFDDDGVNCVMKDGYFCFWAYDLLANHDIELVDIFGNDTNS